MSTKQGISVGYHVQNDYGGGGGILFIFTILPYFIGFLEIILFFLGSFLGSICLTLTS